jgi:hypothetical protein
MGAFVPGSTQGWWVGLHGAGTVALGGLETLNLRGGAVLGTLRPTHLRPPERQSPRAFPGGDVVV